MTTGKTIALTGRTFVGKVMSLLFNLLSRLVITFLPRNKRLLISWLQSPSAVILEPPKIKSDTVSTVSPSISHEVIDILIHVLKFFRLHTWDLGPLPQGMFQLARKIIEVNNIQLKCNITIEINDTLSLSSLWDRFLSWLYKHFWSQISKWVKSFKAVTLEATTDNSTDIAL